MCGRFTQASPTEVIGELFDVAEVPPLPKRYNIAPTQDVAVVRPAAAGRELALLHWGLIPSWAKERAMGARMINARAETLAEKPAFRGAYKARRCLIVADGFFEWQKAGPRKQPWYFSLADGGPFGFAGLWERWEDPEGEAVESCAIVTTTANDVVAPVHDRMPVIVPQGEYELWLAPRITDATRLASVLRPYPAEALRGHPVSLRVNSPGNDDPACIAPVG
jgi:putative SOS response-associated peptidase YedK